MKPGDYIFMEFGHNDQKQKGPGKGAYYSFMTSLKTFIDGGKGTRSLSCTGNPDTTPQFDEKRENQRYSRRLSRSNALVGCQRKRSFDRSQRNDRTLYEAMGVEPSKKAFVHYPAGTYPGQNRVLADNTHFNPYGAYQISKCIIEGIKKAGLPISNYLRSDYSGYNPAHPDALDSFKWNDSPFTEIEKPDGN